MPTPYLASHLQGFGATIFAEMSALAVATGSINLGQGFPDSDGPPELLDAAVEAIKAGHNQYPPGLGIPELRQAIARHQRRWYASELNSDTEILVTAGATEAIAAAMLALLNPGDEVVVFEPLYDSYAATIAMAQGQRKVVTLRAPDYAFDAEELRAAITNRTKLILLNTPHNPTGKVFSRAELELIAQVAREHDLLVVTDEVYEHLVFSGVHIPIASLPGMRDRTLVISSAGKTFSCTGWKIGWVCGPAELVAAVRTTKQFLTYVNGGPFQYAVARGLDLGGSYFTTFIEGMRQRRDLLCDGLEKIGFDVHRPAGTYFATVDVRSVGYSDGETFCRELPHKAGVVAIPSAVFYDTDAGTSLVRFAFCKQLAVLEEALRRLGGFIS
ncbi:MAG: putative succinyldiaminopimelate transaminase DapC [Acidimicrobiales bacterium]|nr:MAG: putative succinyldiaminopimelate transaminase DapC [Acidimicrobiales bacterium]